MPPTTLAFDVYGTLIDTAGVRRSLDRLVGDRAAEMTELWRSKQLEYSFRRALMRRYVDFATCTRQALDFCCAALQVDLSAAQREELLAEYRILPAFADAAPGLQSCHAAGWRLYAFSNGRSADVAHLLEQAGIAQWFTDIVSCDEIHSFKPNPDVYQHFLKRAGVSAGHSWMISGNPFDVTGALACGMRAAWIQRTATAVFDPWELQPTTSAPDLSILRKVIDCIS